MSGPLDLDGSGPNLASSSSVGAISSLHAADSSSTEKSSWSSLFHSGEGAKLTFHQHFLADKRSVFIPKSVHDKGIAIWEYCLVSQFLGASPPLSQIQAITRQIWGAKR